VPISVRTQWRPDPIVIAEELNTAADALTSFAPALAGAREVVLRDIRSNFEGKHDPGGSPWRRWSWNYRDVGERTNVGGLLVQTGNMMRAVLNRLSWQVTGHELFANTAEWRVPNRRGDSNDRWLWHQEGLDNRMLAGTEGLKATLGAEGITDLEGVGENPLPRRSFIGVSEDAEFVIFDIMDEFVDNAFEVVINPKTGFAQRLFRTPRGPRFGPGF